MACVVFAGALQIENSEESDQGKYECVAVNSAGTRYSAPANLYVRGKICNQIQIPIRFTSICFHTGFTTARTGPGAQKLTFLLNHTVVLIETRSCGGELLHCFPMLNNHEMFPHRCSLNEYLIGGYFILFYVLNSKHYLPENIFT